MTRVFAPGCALMLYKPHLAQRLHALLNQQVGPMDMLTTCCRNQPPLKPGTRVINICPGCDRRYRENYEQATTVSLWEVLDAAGWFPYPDYQGERMSIMDACPTRSETRVHEAIRSLLRKMNVALVEPVQTGMKSICCGDSFYGLVPVERVKELMANRASDMPVDDVVVYCVSCTKSVFIGRKRPRYMVDLLFDEETLPGTLDPDVWHAELDEFIPAH